VSTRFREFNDVARGIGRKWERGAGEGKGPGGEEEGESEPFVTATAARREPRLHNL